MLEFVKTIPATCKKIKETYAQSEAFKRFPNTHQGKSRFGLTKGAGQCFIFWNGTRGKATSRVRSPSRPSLDPSSPWLEFVKQSVHLWSFGLRSWLRRSHLSSDRFIK